jgi:RNA-directed DNA polymerase
MTKTPSSLQDLSKSLYDKAKAEPTKRFWGLYVHVCKMETLQEAYEMTKKNDGAPGIDGVTFEVIEESGEFSATDQRRTDQQHVSTDAGTEEGNTKRRGESKNSLDPFHP